MFRMKEKEIVNACLLINEFLKNKDNWMIDKSKSFVIKIKGIKEPMAAKISHISTVGDSVSLDCWNQEKILLPPSQIYSLCHDHECARL